MSKELSDFFVCLVFLAAAVATIVGIFLILS